MISSIPFFKRENIIVSPQPDTWQLLCGRGLPDDGDIDRVVGDIIERVRVGGDEALREIAQEVDHVSLGSFEVSESEFEHARDAVPENIRKAIDIAAANITAFHQAQRSPQVDVSSMPGVRCVQRPVPIESVGIYIPGGSAPLFSTVLMLALPARIAGCSRVVMCTPCGPDGRVNPSVLYSARICGVGRVFKIGGAQAIAALSYGTRTVPAVDKIFGPGNRYVMKAKQMLSRRTAIDMPAGPSEVMVLADGSAQAAFVAADLLSQAEHGPDSQVMLVCDSEALALDVLKQVEAQTELLPRKEIVFKALSGSRAVVLPDRDDMIGFANMYASEHLIISLRDPWEAADRITSAGSVFVGNYSPESAGDYASGTNHTLPTSAWARSCSGVNLDSFMKKITYQELDRDGLASLAETIVDMAEAEGLSAHANAVRVRMGLL